MTPYELAEELRTLRQLHPYQVPPGVEDAADALEALAVRVEELERLGAMADEAVRALGVLAGECEARAVAAEAEVAQLRERVEELEAGELAWRAAVTGARWAGR